VDCAAAEVKVTKIVDGEVSQTACPSSTDLFETYSEPATTICLSKTL